TALTGVELLDRRQGQFTFYRNNVVGQQQLFPGPIQALYHDGRDTLWIGSGASLTRFDLANHTTKTYQAYTGPRVIGRPELRMVGTIVPDEQGSLWFDGMDGLYRFDPASE